MIVQRYIFPGFVFGPIVANFVAAALQGDLMMRSPISMQFLFLAGCGFAIAFAGVDRLTKR